MAKQVKCKWFHGDDFVFFVIMIVLFVLPWMFGVGTILTSCFGDRVWP